MEGSRVRDGSRTLVPHRFTVRLTPDDLAAVRGAAPSLAADLADGALAFARGHGYSLLDRPTVSLRADASVEPGEIVVDAADPATPESAQGFEPRGTDGTAAPDGAGTGGAPVPGAAPDVSGPPRFPPAGSVAEGTAVFVVPITDGPRATIREIRPNGTGRTIIFDGRPLTIGRAPDNGLVVRDGRASRHHARIDGRRGTLVLSDVGSSNGLFVNERRVESVALGVGDRIRIGTTALIVEALGDDVAPAAGRADARSSDADAADDIGR
jgi:hypothetical protein